ncbi:MAG: dienelactone hydrolase [Anaerolineales bacterium]|nr:dienelactone hydrolase [Anaerolineales bacterium]
MIRALYRSATVPGTKPPYDTLTIKVYYPAQFTDSPMERNTGVIPPDRAGAPYPVVILLPGINVGPEAYQWLAESLTGRGMVAVTYSWIAEEMPGFISLTPGVDLDRVRPETFGSGPTCPALRPILEELGRLNHESLLAGVLDLDKIFLGGHSAGGTMALQNANPAWFPQVRGVFAYGGHTGASTMLGWPERTILPVSGEVDVLLIGGTRDGVIEASSHRYGDAASPTGPVARTFDAILPGPGRGVLALIEGGNHFTFAHPADPTTGRAFLDHAPTNDEDELRALMAEMIGIFIQQPDALGRFVEHPLLSKFQLRS